MSTPSRQWLIAILTNTALPAEPCSADVLVAAAEDEGVLALIAESLPMRSATDVPDALKRAIEQAARNETLSQLAMLAEQQRVFAALALAGLPYLVLKGGALAHWLYAKPYLRLVTDLDVLLATQSQVMALEPVLLPLGYCKSAQAGTRIGNEHPFVRPGGPYGRFTVDAHWALLNSPILAERFSFDELMAEAQVLPGCAGARGLSGVHALFNACGHRALNLPYTYVKGIQNAHSLRWLWDIHLLAQALTETQWQQIDTLACAKGLCGILADALAAAVAELGSPVPPALLQHWQKLAENEQVHMHWFQSWPRYQWQQFFASDRQWHGRLSWLWQRLWPNAEAMRLRYGHDGDSNQRVLWRRFAVGMRRMLGMK